MTAISETPAVLQSATALPRPKTRAGARGRVRLGTLNNLRWLAVVGQAVALLLVRVVLNFDFPLLLASSPIVGSAVLNIILAIAYPSARRLSAGEGPAFLAD